jgi:hypothetical protein
MSSYYQRGPQRAAVTAVTAVVVVLGFRFLLAAENLTNILFQILILLFSFPNQLTADKHNVY